MSAAPTLPVVPEEEYLRSTYEPECEYVDGLLLPKPIPKTLHSRFQKLLLMYLAAQEDGLGFEVLPELRLRVAGGRYRVPDLCVFTVRPDADVPVVAPWMTVEVASSGEPLKEILAKVSDHHLMGVQIVVVADPGAAVFVAGPDGLIHQLGTPRILHSELPNGKKLTIDFDQLFAQL